MYPIYVFIGSMKEEAGC